MTRLPGKQSLKNAHPRLVQLLAQAVIGEPADFSSWEDERVFQALRKHKVYALLNRARQLGTATGLGESLIDRLERNARGFALLDLDFQHRTRALLDRLADHRIPALLIKGLPVAHRYYPASHLRHRVDVDLWVGEDDWERLPDLLRSSDCDVRWDRTNALSSHQFTAAVPGGTRQPIVFDIHRTLSNRQLFTRLFSFDDCWAHRERVEPFPGEAWTLDTARQLILTCVHRFAHGRNSERDRLSWLLDAHLMFETLSPESRQAFSELALATGTGTLCADALQHTRALFGTELETDVEAALLSRAADEPAADLMNAGKLGWLMSDLRGQRGAGRKLTYLKETLLNQFR